MQRKLLAVGAAWALLAVSAGPAMAGDDGGGVIGAAQSATNTVTQDASATAETVQLVPVNANVPVAVASPGAGGDVTQSNDASSQAAAGNVAVVDQSADQTAANGGGNGGGGQSASNGVAQTAEAVAETVQALPVNVNAPVAEPSNGGGKGDGCGCQPTPKPRHEGDVEQSNDASSAAAAGNAAIVEQTVEQTAPAGNGHPPVRPDEQQDGGQQGGQSATNEVHQDADAHARTVQLVPVNVNAPIAVASPGAGGDVEQSNDASSTAAAGNAAIVEQDVDQTQSGNATSKPRRPEHPACGCDDKGQGQGGDGPHGSGGQSARNEVDQDAQARSTTWQLVPVNVNAPIAIASPGARGDVEQSNDATSTAGAGNAAVIEQDVDQTQTGGQRDKPHGCACDGKGGKDGTGDRPHEPQQDAQRATNRVDQDADARARTLQLVPVNLNAPVSGPSRDDPGCGCNARYQGQGKPHGTDRGDVRQSNRAGSDAWAGDLAVVGQDLDQTGNGRGSQRATNGVDQDATARAKTVQLLPVNANLPTSDGGAVAAPALVPDGGCGCQGPGGPPWHGPGPGGGAVDQSNTASSQADALNVAFVDQSIGQLVGSRRS